MKPLRLLVSGISGRMGREIQLLAQSDPQRYEVVAGMTKQTNLNKDLAQTRGDVIVDFSSAGFFDELLSWALVKQIPFVSGTTGLNEAQMNEMKKASKKIAILWASNMSLGIAVLRRTLRQLQPLANWDFHIEEMHHSKKKDSPSGTALTLQSTLQGVVEKNIPVTAVRGGGIPGVHRVFVMGAEETLTFEHVALNRAVFARGALSAAAWISKQPAGLYTMDDILGFTDG